MPTRTAASTPLPHRLTPSYVAMMLFLIIAILTVLSVAEQAVIHLMGRADLMVSRYCAATASSRR